MDPEVSDASTSGASSTPVSPATEAPATDGGSSDKGYLDAVMSALKPEEGSQPSEPDLTKTAQTKEGVKPTDKNAQDAEDPTEDEIKQYNPHAGKRIRQLLGERRAAREQAEALNAEVEPLKAQAKIASDLQSFVQTAGLTKDDLDTGFSIMAAMRGDPDAALAALMPIVTALQERTGNMLPAELQQAVREGKITVEHAFELSKSRAKGAHLETVMAERTQAEKAQAQQAEFQNAVSTAASAVSDWERTKSTNDPDWHLKSDRIAQLVELEVRRNGFPQTATKAVEIHQKAFDAVEAEMRKLRPTPRKMSMATGHASPNSKTEPASYMEAALMGLQSRRS